MPSMRFLLDLCTNAHGSEEGSKSHWMQANPKLTGT